MNAYHLMIQGTLQRVYLHKYIQDNNLYIFKKKHFIIFPEVFLFHLVCLCISPSSTKVFKVANFWGYLKAHMKIILQVNIYCINSINMDANNNAIGFWREETISVLGDEQTPEGLSAIWIWLQRINRLLIRGIAGTIYIRFQRQVA